MPRLLDRAAAHVEGAFEVHARRHRIRAADEGLLHRGHAGERCGAQTVSVDRHVAPEEQRDARMGAPFFEDAHARFHAFVVLREEEHGHAVIAFGGQQMAVALRFPAEEAMGDLEEDASAVAGVLFQAGTAAVLEVDERRKRVVEQLVRAFARKVDERGDAAGIVFEFGAPQTARALVAGVLQGGCVCHSVPPNLAKTGRAHRTDWGSPMCPAHPTGAAKQCASARLIGRLRRRNVGFVTHMFQAR